MKKRSKSPYHGLPPAPCAANHIKTGNIYTVISWDAVNDTNARDGERGVFYTRDGLLFYREIHEFREKFDVSTK